MIRPLLALLVLTITLLACMQPVATITPTAPLPAASSTPAATPTAAPPPSPTATLEPDVATVKVIVPVVNVRSGPDGEVIGQLTAGDVVVIGECSENWCFITEPFDGYVFQGCLSGVNGDMKCEAK